MSDADFHSIDSVLACSSSELILDLNERVEPDCLSKISLFISPFTWNRIDCMGLRDSLKCSWLVCLQIYSFYFSLFVSSRSSQDSVVLIHVYPSKPHRSHTFPLRPESRQLEMTLKSFYYSCSLLKQDGWERRPPKVWQSSNRLVWSNVDTGNLKVTTCSIQLLSPSIPFSVMSRIFFFLWCFREIRPQGNF